MSREAAADITVVIPAKNAVATIDAALGSLAPDGALPMAIGLDEDTCFWTAVLARADVIRIAAPVLLY
ncbi:MAG: hypothetical protein E5V17_04175, partial [Mesorhizobium sp.]